MAEDPSKKMLIAFPSWLVFYRSNIHEIYLLIVYSNNLKHFTIQFGKKREHLVRLQQQDILNTGTRKKIVMIWRWYNPGLLGQLLKNGQVREYGQHNAKLCIVFMLVNKSLAIEFVHKSL